MPKVSVIVPSYNHEKFLQKRLDSVFNQTYQDFEVILLDDYSQDNSPEILLSCKNHDKVSHIDINEKNSGSPFSQWQKGIEYAVGEYIWIAESDDWAELNFLGKMISILENGADLAYCRSPKVNDKGEIINFKYWPDSLDNKRWRGSFINSGKEEICNYLCYRNTIPNASACVFRKRDNLFNDHILNSRFTGDWQFWVNYLKCGNIGFTSEELSYHRFHENATRAKKDTNSKLLRLSERLMAIKDARKFCGKHFITIIESYKYKYLFKFISELKISMFNTKILKIVPIDVLLYTALFKLSRFRYKVINKLT